MSEEKVGMAALVSDVRQQKIQADIEATIMQSRIMKVYSFIFKETPPSGQS